ncbi:MAG: RNB domain-containing ribonuclease [Geodermatophilaceae bacterium]
MSASRVSLSSPAFDGVRREFDVPQEFSAAALREAERAAAAPRMPEHDATDLPLVTLDPPGSRDLDQAMHLGRRDGGYRVSYAIADVAAFVQPDGALDGECWDRGVTVYCPDLRVPLHPEVICEAAGSLLPGQNRPAVLWQIDLADSGEVVDVSVRRAVVRSTAQLDYPNVQSTVDTESAHPSLALLPEIGALRLALARQRHAIELNLPDQEVVSDSAGGWTVMFRTQLPVEIWNAQISLLTGMCAARLMLQAGVGVLRTLPPAAEEDVARLRALAPMLGIDWPDGTPVGDVLDGLTPGFGAHAAFLDEAGTLLRGAGYASFDGEPPEQPVHAAVAAEYAHVTAPLRRLVDRFGSEICLAQSAGVPVPGWVRAGLPRLPEAMASADRRAGDVERAVVGLTEAHVLAGQIGADFDAVVVESGPAHGTVVLTGPAVRASCDGPDLPLGQTVRVRLTEADPLERRVRFARVPDRQPT